MAGADGEIPTPTPHRGRGPLVRVQMDSDRGVFMISVAAQLANMHPQTLRMYETRGLIEPQRSPKGTRLYSQEDVEKLRRIQEMTAELGLNLAGVERVLRLEEEIDGMQAHIEQIELEALRAQVRLANELEEVRRSFRAELTVPYRGGLELVRAADARSPFPANPARRRSRDDTA
ncbi:MAG: heat shock protein transcriptional repressor HspR [Solirubrobacteraceae bacterium]